LPGFTDAWEQRRLGEAFDFVPNNTLSRSQLNGECGEVKSVHYGDILIKYGSVLDAEIDEISFITDGKASDYKAQMLNNGDVLFADTAEDETVGKAIEIQGIGGIPVVSGLHTMVCRPRDKFAPTYLGYYINSPTYHRQLFTLMQGIKVLSISKTNLSKTTVMFPADVTEQAKIGEVFRSLDRLITLHQRKLEKAKLIKQGMMSELLTGRIRLVDAELSGATVEARSESETELVRVAEAPVAKGHNQQFDDAVMIAGIVNVLYSDRFPLGRKKVQKCLYLLRRHQDESTEAFKKKAAGPYADEVRYKGGEPIARKASYIDTTTGKQGTTFARGKNISQALGYISSWGKLDDIKWVADKLRFKKVDELELLATVDMAICDLTEAGTPVSVQSIKQLISTNAEWKAKLKKQTFSDANIACAIKELQTLLQGGN
jgi:type I restriction enzyme S subunit